MAVLKDHLILLLDQAYNEDYDFVFIRRRTHGIDDLTIIPHESIPVRKQMYTDHYDDNLNAKEFDDQITGWSKGNLEELQQLRKDIYRDGE